MSESKVNIQTTVRVDEEGQITIETNLPLLDTTLLLQEGATYLIRQARENTRTKQVEDLPDAKEAQ